MHQRWWSREQRRTIPPAWMQDDSSKSRRRSRRIYFPVPLLSDSRTGNAVDVAPGMRESLPSFVRARREEEGTGWRIKQRGSCKSRVETRDTSLALSRLRSAYAMAIEIDLALPYVRHRRPYHRNYGPDPRRGYPWNSTKRSLPSGHFLRWPDLMVIFFFWGGGNFKRTYALRIRRLIEIKNVLGYISMVEEIKWLETLRNINWNVYKKSR